MASAPIKICIRQVWIGLTCWQVIWFTSLARGDYTITPYTLMTEANGTRLLIASIRITTSFLATLDTWQPLEPQPLCIIPMATATTRSLRTTPFAKFGLVYKDAEGKKVKFDFIRKKDHPAYLRHGIQYQLQGWALDVIGGLNLQQFLGGNHWGYLTYIANQDAEKKFFGSNGQYKYYDSDAHKYDYSAFVKALSLCRLLECLRWPAVSPLIEIQDRRYQR